MFGQVGVVKVKLTEAEKEVLRKLARSGGLAGDRKKKSASAKARWERFRRERGAPAAKGPV